MLSSLKQNTREVQGAGLRHSTGEAESTRLSCVALLEPDKGRGPCSAMIDPDETGGWDPGLRLG